MSPHMVIWAPAIHSQSPSLDNYAAEIENSFNPMPLASGLSTTIKGWTRRMPFEFVDLEIKEAVGWFRFNRPPVNAVNQEMLGEMIAGIKTLDADSEAKVIVIASALDRYFNAGADIEAFKSAGGEGMCGWLDQTYTLARTVREASKPVLAAINGVAVGGGLEMSLHADLRFAADDARLGQPEINIALIPPVAGTQGLVRLVGRSNAFKILYGGELVGAAEALAMGLVDFVSPAAQLEDDVQKYAESLAKKPANALAAIRRCLIDGGAETFEAGMAIERQQAEALADHPNLEEGISAFLEKRQPNWT